MTKTEVPIDSVYLAKRTQAAYLFVRILGTPGWSLICMLAFILYKHALLTPFQAALVIALKPTSALLAPYWSQAIYQKTHKVATNLIWANILRHIPFVFTPFFHSSWFMIASFGLYMTLTRAMVPAWMEMLKCNLPIKRREEIVSYGTTIDFVGTALLTILMGVLLDRYPPYWPLLFAISSFLGMLSTSLLIRIPFTQKVIEDANPIDSVKKTSFYERIIKPWRSVWRLLKNDRGFAIFQIGFMLGGGGLMMMHPALPQLFIDTFKLSFTNLSLAVAFCKGIGVACTSPIWTGLFRKINFYALCALVTFFAALFPFLLIATSLHLSFLYLAYICYGIMQAGSELSWHMSALVFAKEQDSSFHSITNVLTVGIRGCFIPFIGSMLLPQIHPIGVILLGAILCISASLFYLASLRSSALRTVLETKA